MNACEGQALALLCSWRSPDRQQNKIRRSCSTERGRSLRDFVVGDRLIANGARAGILLYREGQDKIRQSCSIERGRVACFSGEDQAFARFCSLRAPNRQRGKSGHLALQRGAGLSDLITPVGQDRLILTRSGSGDPELQRLARCAAPPRFSIGIRPPPKRG